MFPVFLVDQCMTAVWAAPGIAFEKAVVIRREVGITDFAFALALPAIVAVKIGLWSIAGRTGAVFRDIALLAPGYGFDLLVVTGFKVGDKELPVPFTVVDLDIRELIGFKLLIFRGVGVVKSPLFERDIFADKMNEPAILLVK